MVNRRKQIIVAVGATTTHGLFTRGTVYVYMGTRRVFSYFRARGKWNVQSTTVDKASLSSATIVSYQWSLLRSPMS